MSFSQSGIDQESIFGIETASRKRNFTFMKVDILAAAGEKDIILTVQAVDGDEHSGLAAGCIGEL